MEFKQVDLGLNRSQFIIETAGIRIIRRGIANSSEVFVEFEQVGSKIIKEKSRKLFWLILCLIALILGVAVFVSRLSGGKIGEGAEIFYLSASIVFFVIYLLTKKSSLYLAQGDHTNAIEFVDNPKQHSRVEKFIKHLLERRNEYLINKYSTFDELLPYEQQYDNLVWLYNMDLLSKDTFQKKISELDRLTSLKNEPDQKPTAKIIGFRNRNSEGSDEANGTNM